MNWRLRIAAVIVSATALSLAAFGCIIVGLWIVRTDPVFLFPFGRAGNEWRACHPFGLCKGELRCAPYDAEGRLRKGQPPDSDGDVPPIPHTCVPTGGAYQLCRADGACGAGLSCVGDRCIPAGGEDEPCRADGACAPGLSCFSGKDLNGKEYRRCGPNEKAASIAAWGRTLCILTQGGKVRCLDTTPPANDDEGRGERVAYPTKTYPGCSASDRGEVSCAPTAPTRRPVIPRVVEGLGEGVRSVSVGYEHACAVTGGGGVRCWGKNGAGQLGDGTGKDSGSPVAVAGLGSGVAAVSAGVGHSCALLDTGTVKCWGDNGRGQLGDGTTISRAAPVEVKGLAAGAGRLAAGAGFTCVVVPPGAVHCWGTRVEETDSGTARRTSLMGPTAVAGLGTDVREIAAWSDLCAVHADGRLQCYGFQFTVSLDRYLSECESCYIPPNNCIVAPGGKGTRLFSGPVAQAAVGYRHGCAVTAGGSAVCFGDLFSDGLCRAGQFYHVRRYPPMDIMGDGLVVKGVAAGDDMACLLVEDGSVWCLNGDRCGDADVGIAGPKEGAATYRARGEEAWDVKRPVCPPPARIPGTGP